ncbi:hypothetical protein MUU53_04255 [Rhizobium lemnae]|uniref:Endonuclease n=1 Tax=Rhizobium lemnae TaxID=1214924 RepID=A0ABV8EDL5_9HYPH|nr:hypothetical protein [Rhizobium lemnae]MCJ8507119.1 hypothetical protein [Rhizobium lemnae]
MSTTTRAMCHIVMWNVAGSTADQKNEAIASVCREFEGLRSKIPGMTLLEVGLETDGVSYVRNRLKGLRIARHQMDYLIASRKVA